MNKKWQKKWRDSGLFVLHKWESDTRTEKEIIGKGMTSEGQIFSQQKMSVALKKMKENEAADESGVTERIYDGSMVKFELEKVMTGWCKGDSGVRQGCSLSPLIFNIYVRELGKGISNCVHGVKYAVVGKDGVIEWKSQAGLLYTDDVCLMVNSEEDMNVIMEKVNECVVEYGLKVNEKKIPRWCA